MTDERQIRINAGLNNDGVGWIFCAGIVRKKRLSRPREQDLCERANLHLKTKSAGVVQIHGCEEKATTAGIHLGPRNKNKKMYFRNSMSQLQHHSMFYKRMQGVSSVQKVSFQNESVQR